MRIIRRLIVIFFILVTIGFIGWRVMWYMNNDTETPQITCPTEPLQVSISATDAELLTGITARDNRDGDVTDSLVVVSKSKFSSEGKRKVTYAAFDSQSNVATCERTIVYTDYASPRFTLTKPLRFESYSFSILDHISVTDCIDGDLSSLIKLYYDSNTYVSYQDYSTENIIFQVTNSAGDTARLNLVAEMYLGSNYQQDCPALTDYLIYVPVGEELNLKDYIAGYSYGDCTSVTPFSKISRYSIEDVTINDSALDCSKPGYYRVIYTLHDSFGDSLGNVSLYIIVEGAATDE